MWCCPQTGRNLEGKRMRRHVLRDTVVVFITAGYSGKKCACSCPCAAASLSLLSVRHGSSCEMSDACMKAGRFQQDNSVRSLAVCATGERSAKWWRSVPHDPMLRTS